MYKVSPEKYIFMNQKMSVQILAQHEVGINKI